MIKIHNVGVRLDDLELARLERLATSMGLRRQDVVRVLLKRAHDEQIISRPRNA